MLGNLSSREFSLFQKYIKEQCGIVIGDEKAYLIESRLTKILIDSGLSSFEELYYKLSSNKDIQMAEKVVDAITTNETLWFRDKTPWVILEEEILPKLVEALRRGDKKKIRIWSAAASTGQEAYSTAMCIHRYLKRKGIKDINLSHFDILATDISQPVLQVAKAGKYDAISIMRGLDGDYKDTYFKNEGRIWEIRDEIKTSIRFQKFNLQNSFLSLGKFDVIFCRYVMIYFSNEFKRELLQKMWRALEEDGIFYIGNSEILQGYEKYFEEAIYERGIYFKKKKE